VSFCDPYKENTLDSIHNGTISEDNQGACTTNSTRSTSSLGLQELYPQKTSSFWGHIYWRRPATIVEDLLTNMGACLSSGGGAALIENTNGGEEEYHARFTEDRVLGEGEFGVVTLVHDMKGNWQIPTSNDANEDTMACKTLRKGVQFKDNTLYAPIKPEILQSEVNILRKLNGDHYCLKMFAVYETPRVIYLVTEYCAGGDTFSYVSKQEEDLRTDDVSRISYQLLSAVDHCAKNNVIHRDIKPENLMFISSSPGSDMRLIDFGSGTDKEAESGQHTTFAGSAFYISPELYQRTYTQKTDVWSAGVCLYVLVAGYPADKLQKAFNMLQSENRNLKELPNMPDDMPDSYYDMLEGLLKYKHKQRKSAGEMLKHEFVQFHESAFSVENIMLEAANIVPKDGSKKSRTTQSVSIRGSVGRHSLFLDYQKFERSLTTLLATLLTKKELDAFVVNVHETLAKEKEDSKNEGKEEQSTLPEQVDKMTLDIIRVDKMKKILEKDGNQQILEMIDKLPGSKLYSSFAYDTALLQDFVFDSDKGRLSHSGSARFGRSLRLSGGSFRGSLRGSFRSRSIFGKKQRSGSFSSVGGKSPFRMDNASR